MTYIPNTTPLGKDLVGLFNVIVGRRFPYFTQPIGGDVMLTKLDTLACLINVQENLYSLLDIGYLIARQLQDLGREVDKGVPV